MGADADVRLAVVGSRGYGDYELLAAVLDLWPRAEVVTGGALGADTLAERWARSRSRPARIYRADWRRHGRSAGYLRNQDVIANADLVVAFWDGKSRGTRHAIRLARQLGVPRIVLRVDESERAVVRDGAAIAAWRGRRRCGR